VSNIIILNKFEIKSIKLGFNELNIIGVIMHVNQFQESWYTIYSQYNGILFANRMMYSSKAFGTRKPNIADFTSTLSLRVKSSRSFIKSTVFSDRVATGNEVKHLARRISHFFVEQVDCFLNNCLTKKPTETMQSVTIERRLKKMLINKITPRDAYIEIMLEYGLDFTELPDVIGEKERMQHLV